METNQDRTIHPEDEISLKNFIQKLKEYFREVLKNWWLLGLFAIPFVIYLAYSAITAPLIYPAKMTFMVNEESGGGGANMGGVLSYFGVGGSGGNQNLSKVLELFKSREITKRALFTVDSSSTNSNFLANEIIREYDLNGVLGENNPAMSDFIYKHNEFDRFSREENSVLKYIHSLIIGGQEREGLMKLEVNTETSIFKMSINAKTEPLAISMLEAMYDALSDFYINETIEKPKHTFDNLQERTDSVGRVMHSLEYRLAKNIDANRGLVSRESQLNRDRLDRDLRAAGMEYGKLLENLSAAEFTLENATPFFQIIDPPIEPISSKKESLIRAIVLGLFIGIFLGIIYVLLRKIYRDVMEN